MFCIQAIVFYAVLFLGSDSVVTAESRDCLDGTQTISCKEVFMAPGVSENYGLMLCVWSDMLLVDGTFAPSCTADIVEAFRNEGHYLHSRPSQHV